MASEGVDAGTSQAAPCLGEGAKSGWKVEFGVLLSAPRLRVSCLRAKMENVWIFGYGLQLIYSPQ